MVTQVAQHWLTRLRDQGRQHFDALGYPTLRDEQWRFTNVAPIAQTPFSVAEPGAPLDASQLQPFLFDHAAALLVLVDGHVRAELSQLGNLPPTVTVRSLRDMLATHEPLIEAHLGKHAEVDGDAFTALNIAQFVDGAFVHVPAEVTLERPIHLLLVSTAAGQARQSHIRNLIIAGRGSTAAVVEHYVSVGQPGAACFSNAVTEAVVGQGADLTHYYIEQDDERTYAVGTLAAQQQADSRLHSHTVLLGGALVRNNVHIDLAGRGAWSLVNGLFVAQNRQHMDNHMRVVHAAERCESRQFYKGILADQARGVFAGRIIVRPGAQKTDAKQTSRNLLLSDDAQINAQPQLEIYADDVKCTHGATTGRLDENALFYLRCRGIDLPTARAMLVHAFAQESLDRISDESVRAYLAAQLHNRLHQLVRTPSDL